MNYVSVVATLLTVTFFQLGPGKVARTVLLVDRLLAVMLVILWYGKPWRLGREYD